MYIDMASPIYIYANPGNIVRLVLQTTDGYGDLTDGYVPEVRGVLFPDFSSAAGYPQVMTNVSTGLYTHGLVIPTGAAAVGTYIATVFWRQDGNPKWEVFAIQVARPFGISSASPL